MDPHKTQCLSNWTLVKHNVLEAPMSKTHSEITTFAFQDDHMPHLPLSFPFLFPISFSFPLFSCLGSRAGVIFLAFYLISDKIFMRATDHCLTNFDLN